MHTHQGTLWYLLVKELPFECLCNYVFTSGVRKKCVYEKGISSSVQLVKYSFGCLLRTDVYLHILLLGYYRGITGYYSSWPWVFKLKVNTCTSSTSGRFRHFYLGFWRWISCVGTWIDNWTSCLFRGCGSGTFFTCFTGGFYSVTDTRIWFIYDFWHSTTWLLRCIISGLSRLQRYLDNGPSHPKCRCLVRWEGFDDTHDTRILWKHVTLESITVYEQILTNEDALGRTVDKVKLANVVGKQGPFSALTQNARQQVQQQLNRLQRAHKLSHLRIQFIPTLKSCRQCRMF